MTSHVPWTRSEDQGHGDDDDDAECGTDVEHVVLALIVGFPSVERVFAFLVAVFLSEGDWVSAVFAMGVLGKSEDHACGMCSLIVKKWHRALSSHHASIARGMMSW